jgi:D-threo-aldose 1-dehydrogenase
MPPPLDANYNYAPASVELVERARAITAVCELHGTTLPAAAIAFPLGHRSAVSVCVGAWSALQIRRNTELYREMIAAELWAELKARELLREDAPVPG